MIERNFHNGPIVLRCDACAPEYCETEEKDLTAALAVAKDEGWTVRRLDDGSFGHYCEDCTADRAWERESIHRMKGARR